MTERPPNANQQAKLIIFGGFPGVGKTEIARELALQLGAVYLRIDSIEQGLLRSGLVSQIDDSGYRVAYAMAEEKLRVGQTVVADCVNPLAITRDSWVEVARRAGVPAIEIEVQCSDPNEHRRRVELRKSDIPGLLLPTWEEVLLREYHPWNRDCVRVETANRTPEQNVAWLRKLIQSHK
jgi:predicted kinase